MLHLEDRSRVCLCLGIDIMVVGGCTGVCDIALVTANVLGIRTSCWLQRMYMGLGTLRWLLRVLCGGCSGCLEDGKGLEGHDTCHCVELAHYCFTAFIHIINCCLIRKACLTYRISVCIIYITYMCIR